MLGIPSTKVNHAAPAASDYANRGPPAVVAGVFCLPGGPEVELSTFLVLIRMLDDVNAIVAPGIYTVTIYI